MENETVASPFTYEEHTFATPFKKIITGEQIEEFMNSQSYLDIGGFVQTLTKAVRSTKMSDAHLTNVR